MNDIDAIRSILAALDGRSLDKRPALAGRLAETVPALCDEIEQLRAKLHRAEALIAIDEGGSPMDPTCPDCVDDFCEGMHICLGEAVEP